MTGMTPIENKTTLPLFCLKKKPKDFFGKRHALFQEEGRLCIAFFKDKTGGF
jgi:hypothetical protein